MLQLLQDELGLVFDLHTARLEGEPAIRGSEDESGLMLNFGSNSHVSAMLFRSADHRRYLSPTVHYGGEPLPEIRTLSFSPLPFDGPYHRHSSYELTYVAEGSFSYVMSGQELKLGAGEAVLMDMNCVHFDRNRDTDAAVLFCYLGASDFRALTEKAGKNLQFPSLLSSESDDAQRYIHYSPRSKNCTEEIEQLLSRLIRERNSAFYGTEEMLVLLVSRLLLRLEEDFLAEAVKLPGSLKKDLFLIELDRYIRDNLPTVTTDSLVRQFHFNSDYFCRKIKRKYGVTLTAYIQQRRIERACALLIGTDKAILDIIAELGYKNVRYFYDLFQEQTGLTPAAFRKARRQLTSKSR